jgi:uncharacterized protein (DUF1015 family)
MKYSAFNTEPVLMTYSDNKTIENWIFHRTQKLADFEFSTEKRNQLWKIDDVLEIKWIQNVLKKSTLYLADGHHRSAAAALCQKKTRFREYR